MDAGYVYAATAMQITDIQWSDKERKWDAYGGEDIQPQIGRRIRNIPAWRCTACRLIVIKYE